MIRPIIQKKLSISTVNWPLQDINNFCSMYGLWYDTVEEEIDLIEIVR